ncbi:MAG: DUF3788 domain-containing protein [Clostridiales bacterium]|nr:DUF3788 domain-containing protein [Clostridiales bacterium]
MIDLSNREHCPTLEEIAEYVKNPVFTQFCLDIKNQYQCSEKIEFSCCSLERGWNVKFKKAGKALCTIYPRENFFTAMIVVGRKEKEYVEAILSECTLTLQEIYDKTREGNGQKWLMIDIEDRDEVYRDAFRLMNIRRTC